MKRIKNFSAILIGFLIIQLSACGFHLRGAHTMLPADLPITVSSNKNTISPYVAQVLSENLEQPGEAGKPAINVVLQKAFFNKRVLVLDRNAQPLKHLLVFNLNYSFSQDSEILDSDTIVLERSYVFSSTALAQLTQYEEGIKKQLLEQAAEVLQQKLKRRLAQVN